MSAEYAEYLKLWQKKKKEQIAGVVEDKFIKVNRKRGDESLRQGKDVERRIETFIYKKYNAIIESNEIY